MHLGTCFGKFTKSLKFRLHVTCLDYLAQFAKYKVWVKPSSELSYLYGNNVLKAGLGRITENTPQYQVRRPALHRRTQPASRRRAAPCGVPPASLPCDGAGSARPASASKRPPGAPELVVYSMADVRYLNPKPKLKTAWWAGGSCVLDGRCSAWVWCHSKVGCALRVELVDASPGVAERSGHGFRI